MTFGSDRKHEGKQGEKNLAGVKCRKCFGASWRPTEADDTPTFSRILTRSCVPVEMGTCEKESGRVQDPQNTIEAAKIVSFEKKFRPL